MEKNVKKAFGIACVLSLAPFSAVALAHDTETAHASRGACERELARINNADRAEARPFMEEFDFTSGDVNRFFHARFQCEKRGNSWFIADLFAD